MRAYTLAMTQDPVLFALDATREFGEKVALHLGLPLSPHEEQGFDDGEHKSRSLVNVRGRDVFVVHSLHSDAAQSVNDKLCRLLFFIGALKDASAASVTAVVPYLAYARKDQKSKPRDPVTTRYVARMFEAAGTDRVVTMDVHNLAAFQNAFRCPTEHLEANTQFEAAPETPPGLCLGFGRLPSSDQLVADASEEAAKQDFLPHHGSRYALGPYSGRLVDVLPALPGTRTTTVDDPRTARYSESERAHKVGMHLDNAWTRGGEGERYACSVRVASADRRIIHNMGPGNRSIVVALNMSSQYLSDGVSPGNGQHIPTSRNLRDFLAENPDELSRVVCVVWTIEVGDLVVLPAGTAKHDGSMEGHRVTR